MDTVDLLIVGGGINGAGIARDAAGRGLSVLLVEKDDLASHTSSASTKLIHGGLRYLEHYDLRLVRKALAEREVLLRNAAHIMWPLRFVLPHEPHLRPAWMIRAGLFLYDHLAHREWLPGSHGIDLRTHPAGAPLRDGVGRGFEYSDGWVDDARLVVLNARDAAARGAQVCTRTALVGAHREAVDWVATLCNQDGQREVRARAIVNAAGPFAHAVLADALGHANAPALRLVRGSHIVLRRVFDHAYAYIFQNIDGRIVFAIPYEDDFTLIGTTDCDVHTPDDAQASESEIAYLLEAAERYFRAPMRRKDVVHTFGGIRPLLDGGGSASAVTRDYALDLDSNGPPLLNVWGGKITTYRRLAEEVLAKLARPMRISRSAWTHAAPLPGGDFVHGERDPQHAFATLVEGYVARFAQHDRIRIVRLARRYGTEAEPMLADTRADVATNVAPAELEHAFEREWARTPDDFLWRRTKLGLRLDAADRARIAAWFVR